MYSIRHFNKYAKKSAIMNIVFEYLKMQLFSCFEYFVLTRVLRIFCSRRFRSKTYTPVHTHTIYVCVIYQEFSVWLTFCTVLTVSNNEKPNMITSVICVAKIAQRRNGGRMNHCCLCFMLNAFDKFSRWL